MSSGPSMKRRLMAAFHHEVSAADLEAYRAAGAAVYQFLDHVGAGFDPSSASDVERLRVLCSWVAFALQSAGDALVDSDYDSDPSTVGFVPEVTRRQAMSFYLEVADWVSAAGEAAADPAFGLAMPIPTRWPAWVEVDPCPRPHLAAMVATAQRLSERVLLLAKLDGTDGAYGQAAGRIAQLLAGGDARRDRAVALWQGGARSIEAHENIETLVKEAIASYFLAGQLMAMPDLAAKVSPAEPVTASRGRGVSPAPGQPAFDLWCLTDPASRQRFRRDRAARRALDMLWRYDPDPSRTLGVQAEIDGAADRGDITADGQGNYFCCPWSSIYQVINPVTLGGKRLRRGQQFTFDVSGEEVGRGGPFKREILVAQFQPTDEIDYCNPDDRH